MDKRPFDPQEVVEQIARGEIACGDFELRIDRDGRWHYRGTPIERARLVRLFSTALHRAADGTYWLVTPIERGRVQVDDAPFVAVEMRVSGEGSERAIDFRTNI